MKCHQTGLILNITLLESLLDHEVEILHHHVGIIRSYPQIAEFEFLLYSPVTEPTLLVFQS